ncbi:MAG: PDZ domain-containing protein, partial [Chitinophagaceae bacterium]
MNIKILSIVLLISSTYTVNAQQNEPEKDIREERVIIRKRSNESPKAFLGVATQKASNGVKVSDVVEGSAAEKSGLEKGDVITKLNGKEIEDPSQFSENIRGMKPGETIELSVIKDGDKKEHKIKAQLGQVADEERFSYSFQGSDGQWELPAPPPPPGYGRRAPVPNEKFGFREFEKDIQPYFNRPFDEWKNGQKPQLGIHVQDTEESKGVKVVDVKDGSAAAKAGIVENDLITEIDGT